MKKYIQVISGILISAILVWWLFHDTNWQEVGTSIKNIKLGWFALAHVPLLFSFLFRIIRWKYIVNAVHPTSFMKLASATQIGFMANMTLPLRAGEAVRALVLTRLNPKIPFSKSFAFVAIDRLTDLFGLIAVMFVALVAFQPEVNVTIPADLLGMANDYSFTPNQYRMGAYGIAIALSIIIGSFVLLYFRKAFILKLVEAIVGVVSQTLADLGVRLLTQFADGLEAFKSPRDMVCAIFFSLLTWLMPVLFFMCTFKAFGFDVPWYTAFVMQSILSVFIAVPGAPGFVGQFHVPIVITLVMMNINLDQAKAFAIVNHLAQLPPILISGAYFLITDDFSMTSLASEGKDMAHEEALHEIEEAEEESV